MDENLDLTQALDTFIAESRELLEAMESDLVNLNQEPDAETINALFRAAHTIKGSAGLFGLQAIVEFTHVLENVLERVRLNEINLDADLVHTLLGCKDYLGGLVDQVAAGNHEPVATPEAEPLLAALRQSLAATHDTIAAEPTPSPTPDNALQPLEAAPTIHGPGVHCEHWHISLRFSPDVLRNGMDPISFIGYLNTIGRILNTVTLIDALPKDDSFDPESCYLGFEIALATDANRATIEEVFEFVANDAQIRILPPQSLIQDYIQLIQELPEDELMLGEILVSCGTITRAELDRALRQQFEQEESAQEKRPIGEILVEQHGLATPVVEAALQKQQHTKVKQQQERRLVRIDADKLDKLINEIGELVIANATVAATAMNTGNTELLEATSHVARLVESVRDSALALRMVQIGATFSKFQRVVHDVSREMGKDIELIIAGGETELDKTVVDRIADPLTHLVRNAIDHGIESAESRIAQGKSATGQVRLTAYHEFGSIVIEVADDGKGLDKDRILAKAQAKGLVDTGQQTLSDTDIYNFIFEPGFSTAEQVTNLSGRGVGMDVVRRNINELRGSIDIASQLGRGTTFRIRLPLTLAIIDGFLCGVADAAFVIPLDMVTECIECPHDPQLNQKGYADLRGEVLPLVQLRQWFRLNTTQRPRRQNIIVVHFAGRKAGLVVDRLMGEFQTVIKPLGALFSHTRGIGGATILGSGEVALIIDVPSLVTSVTQEPQERAHRASHSLQIQD